MKWFSLHKLVRSLAWIIPCSIILAIWIFTIYILQTNYQSLLYQIVENINRPDIADRIQHEFFTENKFHLLQMTLIGASGLALIGIGLLFKYRAKYHRFLDSITESLIHYNASLKSLFKNLRQETKWIYFLGIIIVLIRSIYYANHFYIQYDEAWNYNLFLDKQFYYSIGAYNNYPLHNLVTWCLVHVFGNSVFILRLPSILMGLMAISLLFISIIYFFKLEIGALLITGIFACLPVTIFYMMYSRGVMFELSFALATIAYLFKNIDKKIGTKHLILLGILNALGTFSMVSHIYFIMATGMALFLYALINQKSLIRISILYVFYSIALSLLLLIPMMLGTGLKPGISAGFKSSIPSLFEIFKHSHDVSNFITGYSFILPGAFIIHVILILYTWRTKKQYALFHLIGLCLLLLFIIIPLTTGTILPERALSFLVVSCIAICTIPFYKNSLNQFSSKLFISLGLMLMVIFSIKSHTHHFLNWSKKLDKYVFEAAGKFQQYEIHSAYNDCRDFDYFIPGIEFYYKQHNSQIEFQTSSIQSTRYRKILPFNTTCYISCNDSSSINSKNSIMIFSLKNIEVYYRDTVKIKP